MGLIKAFAGSVSSTLADQWKEFFYCESMPNNVLVTKGVKRVNARRSSNTKGSENVISQGSGIAVADGQAMIIVEQGRIVEFSSEPGAYTFDSSTEPSIFAENLGKGLIDLFKTVARRFTYGGDTGKDQRVYYFNLKEILDNKFGTSTPIPFRVVDSKIGLDLDVSVRCFGTFSYKITNPILFYQNVCGNVSDKYTRDQIDGQIKNEFMSGLQPGFAKLSALEIRPNQIVAHTTELCDAINAELTANWKEMRGIEVNSVAIGSVTLPEEDAKLIKEAQKTAILRDPGMAGATLLQAQSEAMKTAAGNSAGAMHGFVGMGFANNAAGMANAGAYYGMAAEQQAKKAPEAPANGWKCPKCGAIATGKFCPECGEKKPEETVGWKCPKCGSVNKGKFCTECGEKKPANEPLYKCDKCGWEPKDPKNPPKFCPECGDPFDDKDVVNK